MSRLVGDRMDKTILRDKVNLLGKAFKKVFDYEKDDEFLKRIAGLDEVNKEKVLRFKKWDWIHGVGLYGYWKIYEFTKDKTYLELLENYYEERIREGLPEKNINSVCPLLALTHIYEVNPKEEYLEIMKEWSNWIMEELPRTKEGGFQHITAESDNKGQLWDDTLFMTVLFLARAGILLQNASYVEEAKYQFLIHIKYLVDRETGLWYHGWTFEKGHNFAKALWARGNCWITIAIPEFIEITNMKDGAVKRFLVEALKKQVHALKDYQDDSGLWYTIINEKDNYVEASGSAGCAYGILKSIKAGLIEEEYLEVAVKPLEKLIGFIDQEGLVHQVSIGTPMGETIEFYKQIGIEPMPYGQALMMLYLIELLK